MGGLEDLEGQRDQDGSGSIGDAIIVLQEPLGEDLPGEGACKQVEDAEGLFLSVIRGIQDGSSRLIEGQ